jgi:hypothetical protein
VLTAALAYLGTRPAYLDVRVTPGDARVLLDGEPLAVTDGRALVARSPGRHHLAVRADGHLDQEQQVVLVRGRDNSVLVNVELASTTGYLHRASDPPGAAAEVVNERGEVCARGATPFFSPRLPSGEYVLRLRKELYRPAEVTMTVPTGDRVAEGEVVKLQTDPQYSESAQLFEIVRKLSGPVDFPGTGPEATLLDFLRVVSERYGIDIAVNEAAMMASGRPDLAKGKWAERKVREPASRISLRALLRAVLDRPGLDYVPRVKRGGEGFTLLITTREWSEETKYTALYPVGDLLDGADNTAPQRLIIAIRQSVGSPSDWAFGASSVGYHLDLQALQVKAPWYIQEGLYDYLTELRLTRLGGQRARP